MGRRNLNNILADLRLDLKDSGAVWSDPELTRCVQKAVSDYSRFSPRQLRYETTIDYTVTGETVTMPAALSATAVCNAVSIDGESSGATLSLSTLILDVPRPLAVLLTDANNSVSGMTLIIKGLDVDGNYIEESFYRSDGKSQTGIRYFKSVTQVELDSITGNGPGDTISVGTATPDGVWVSLANMPIRPQSETVTGYTRDSDYIIDNYNGKIAMKVDGTISAGAVLTIGYTKSKIHFDLSSIPYFIRFNRVEYPTRDVPQSYQTADLWGDVLTITGDSDSSQSEVSNKEHLAIQYYAMHTIPAKDAAGSYPEHIEDTVMLAASAYALFIEALEYELQAVTDMASARTEITLTTDIHTLVAVALAKVAALSVASSGKVDLALTKVALYMETSDTTDNAKDVLANITDDIADLRDAIKTALDLTSTYLTGASAPSGKKYLDDGDAKIDDVNIGRQVPENYAEYAKTAMQIYNGLIMESNTRLANIRSIIEEAGAWGDFADTFIGEAGGWLGLMQASVSEAQGLIAEITTHIAETNAYLEIANGSMLLAERYRAEGSLRRDEAWAIWRDPQQHGSDFTLTAVRQAGG